MNRLIIALFLFFGYVSFAQDSLSTEEGVDSVPLLYFVKDMPYYDDCKDLVGRERNVCTANKISELVKENFKLPSSINKRLDCTIRIKFVVNRKGKITNVELIEGCDLKKINTAALKAVKKLPKLNPGFQLGKPVPLLYTIPLKIKM